MNEQRTFPAKSPRPIKAVIVWQNGMVMVFGIDGQQIPEYQGPVEEVGEALAAVFPRERWEHGVWRHPARERM